MKGAEEPWKRPAGGHTDGGGVTKTVIGKPLETMGRKVLEASMPKGNCVNPLASCQSDCGIANHGKPWDCKVKGPTV